MGVLVRPPDDSRKDDCNSVTLDLEPSRTVYGVHVHSRPLGGTYSVHICESDVHARFNVRQIHIQDIVKRENSLEGLDVLVMPSGSDVHYKVYGLGQFEALGEKGMKIIKQAVSGGMVYDGICAGAFLMCKQNLFPGICIMMKKTVCFSPE